MMGFRRWLYEVFFPRWANESIIRENKQLRAKNTELLENVQRLKAYIDGFEDGIRSQRRIIINNNVKGAGE